MYKFEYVLWLAVGILAFDAIGLLLWIITGQHPVDDFYWGALTAKILGIFI